MLLTAEQAAAGTGTGAGAARMEATKAKRPRMEKKSMIAAMIERLG